jgi:hypothetical protein
VTIFVQPPHVARLWAIGITQHQRAIFHHPIRKRCHRIFIDSQQVTDAPRAVPLIHRQVVTISKLQYQFNECAAGVLLTFPYRAPFDGFLYRSMEFDGGIIGVHVCYLFLTSAHPPEQSRNRYNAKKD